MRCIKLAIRKWGTVSYGGIWGERILRSDYWFWQGDMTVTHSSNTKLHFDNINCPAHIVILQDIYTHAEIWKWYYVFEKVHGNEFHSQKNLFGFIFYVKCFGSFWCITSVGLTFM